MNEILCNYWVTIKNNREKNFTTGILPSEIAKITLFKFKIMTHIQA